MKKHTKVYIDHFDYTGEEFMPCEVCGARAVDIHHIDARGMGGTKEVDKIENLMGLCRSCHIEYGDKKSHIDFLKKVHKDFIKGYK